MSKEEIIAALDLERDHVMAWFESYGSERWSYSPAEDKWTSGQHLEHLIRSLKPLTKALGTPKIGLRLSFGKPNRPMRDLHMILEKYERGIAGGFKTVGPFIPPEIEESGRQVEMLNSYREHHKKLNAGILKWSEKALDNYLLPHPAMGKMMVREILYFTIIHTRHHLRILRERHEAMT